MKAKRRWLLAAILLVVPLFFATYSRGDRDEAQFQWDLISIDANLNLKPGGQDSAAAADKSSILTLTGSGTFQLGDPEEVTGGGTWNLGASNGTYQVTRLVRFTLAPCTVPSCVSGFGGTDLVGNEKDARSGLAVLEIKYSDGSRGVLFVSCALNGTPAPVFEGINASKGFVDFWDQSVNAPNNATILHILHREEH